MNVLEFKYFRPDIPFKSYLVCIWLQSYFTYILFFQRLLYKNVIFALSSVITLSFAWSCCSSCQQFQQMCLNLPQMLFIFYPQMISLSSLIYFLQQWIIKRTQYSNDYIQMGMQCQQNQSRFMIFQRKSIRNKFHPQLEYIETQQTLRCRAKTHKILPESNLMKTINQYEKSNDKASNIHKTTLKRLKSSVVKSTPNIINIRSNRNYRQLSSNKKIKMTQLTSANNEQQSLKRDKSLNDQFKTIDSQFKNESKRNKDEVSIKKPFSTISNDISQTNRQIYNKQKNRIDKQRNHYQKFEPIHKKLKIFRQKIKLSQNANKNSEGTDYQHRQIQRIIQSLQKQENIHKKGLVSFDQKNSTKQQINNHLLETQSMKDQQDDNKKKTVKKNNSKNDQFQQENLIKLHYQHSLLKIALKQKTQLNLNYLNKKPLLKERYQILQKIGRGLSGQVFKAKDILSDRIVAVKVLINNFNEQQYSFYKQNQHKNIVSYYNNFVEKNTRYLILQYFPYTLQTYIKCHRINQNQIKFIFKNIICGLSFLHAMSIAHRDIKLNNIVVSEKLQTVKFIDFGLCIDTNQCFQQKSKEMCGTVRYMPPEILQKKQYNPRKADIWSLGIVLYYLVHNKFPYNRRNECDMLQKINKTKLSIQTGTNNSLNSLLRGMLNKKPAQRLQIVQILDSSWLNSQ